MTVTCAFLSIHILTSLSPSITGTYIRPLRRPARFSNRPPLPAALRHRIELGHVYAPCPRDCIARYVHLPRSGPTVLTTMFRASDITSFPADRHQEIPKPIVIYKAPVQHQPLLDTAVTTRSNILKMKLSTSFSILAALIPCALGQAAEWGQCGGIGWTGPTTCVSGTTCTFQNDYYSQCLPGASTVRISSYTIHLQIAF